MAKDDYFIIVYKILEYLYECMRKGKDVDLFEIRWDSKAIDISQEYWESVIRNMSEDGYIRGVHLIPMQGRDKPGVKFSGLEITSKGIEYLQDNSKMNRIAVKVKTVSEILGMFI